MKRYIHGKYFLIYILLLFIYACKGTDDYSQANNNPTADLLNKSYKDSLRTNPKEALQRLEALCNQVTSDSVYYYTLRMNIAECHYINGKLKEAEVESQRIIDFCKRWNPQESVRQLMFHALNNCGVCLQEMGNRNEAINHYKEAEKYADTQECIASISTWPTVTSNPVTFWNAANTTERHLHWQTRPKANPNGIPFWQDWQNCIWKWKISRKQTSISEGSYILTYTNSIK